MTTGEWLANRLEKDKEDDSLDWARAEGMDERDRRATGGTCQGDHTVGKNGRIKNSHMVMYRCTVKGCGIRLLYVPSYGSTGATRKATPLDQLVEQGTEEIPAKAKVDPPKSAKAGATPKVRANKKVPSKSKEDDSEEELRVPAPEWDGDPETWEIYRDAMEEWVTMSKRRAPTPSSRSKGSPTPSREAEGSQTSGVSWKHLFSEEGLQEEVNRRRHRSERSSARSSHMVSESATPGAAAPKRQPRRG